MKDLRRGTPHRKALSLTGLRSGDLHPGRRQRRWPDWVFSQPRVPGNPMWLHLRSDHDNYDSRSGRSLPAVFRGTFLAYPAKCHFFEGRGWGRSVNVRTQTSAVWLGARAVHVNVRWLNCSRSKGIGYINYSGGWIFLFKKKKGGQRFFGLSLLSKMEAWGFLCVRFGKDVLFLFFIWSVPLSPLFFFSVGKIVSIFPFFCLILEN